MRRVGHIVSMAASGRAVVELADRPACARCSEGRGCGAGAFAPGAALRIDCALAVPETATAPDPPLRVGARVEVVLEDEGSGWLVTLGLAYGLPTLGLLAGAFAPEPWTPFAALAGLVGGLLAWRVANAWHGAPGGEPSATAHAGPCRPPSRTTAVRTADIRSRQQRESA